MKLKNYKKLKMKLLVVQINFQLYQIKEKLKMKFLII